ncbi:MAG: polyprenyl synthetase family protein [Patescibacteria group bacterium]|nr:polyprenyl synthetase family protein [Patescibacteria group bacterium]
MSLTEKLNQYRKKIFRFLDDQLMKVKPHFLTYSKTKEEIFSLYQNFVSRGKGIRSSLVFLTDEWFNQKRNFDNKNLFFLASFLEIIHSTLLIHDDVMDRDTYRRGEKTVNFYFQEKYQGLSNWPEFLGSSLAVNLGDLGFFLGSHFLEKIITNQPTRTQLSEFLVSEYLKVALAQMDDITYSLTDYKPTLAQIKRIYLYKTARYTFVVPVIATLILTGNQQAKNPLLIKVLEGIGILFQITDDLIGFLSDKTGKTLGSDIKENKKTIVYHYLYPEICQSSFVNLFGRGNLSKSEISRLREFYLRSAAKKKIETLIKNLKMKIKNILAQRNFPRGAKADLDELTDYLISREK